MNTPLQRLYLNATKKHKFKLRRQVNKENDDFAFWVLFFACSFGKIKKEVFLVCAEKKKNANLIGKFLRQL